MKYLFIILFSIASLSTSAQDSKKPPVKVDSTKALVTDSTLIFCARDLEPLYNELKKLPYGQAKPFIEYMERLIATRVEEFKAKQKKQ